MNVPKLRFPEFRDAGEWNKDELGKVSSFVNERMPLDQLSLANYVSTENLLPDYEGLKPSSKLPSLGSVTRFKIDDILISNIRPYLKKVWFSSKEGGASNDVIVIRAKEQLINHYLSFMLKNDVFIEYVMKGAKGVKMPRGDISLIQEYPITYPSKPEQQKIADCLSSIDNLITTETQKLDTLKIHEKGLMQQLFPAEAETIPKLRFPEFRDAGEWEQKKMGEICDCIVPGRDKPRSFTGDIPWITIPDIQGLRIHSSVNKLGLSVDEIKECGAKIVPKNSVIMSCVGSFDLISICEQDLVINQQLHAWLPNSKINNCYLAYSLMLQKKQMERMATSTTVAYLNKSSCNALTIPLPALSEQQKVADCLSSLDELISAQTKKIDILKTHKKSLMQQLFPKLDEVEK